MAKFTKADIGCYADGALGHEHARRVLLDLLWEIPETLKSAKLIDELGEEMSDDASEEDDALDLLNQHCEEGVSFQFVDGELFLLDDATVLDE